MPEMDQIKYYFENKTNLGASQVLSEQTCSDMDFDDFFYKVDYTSSCVGRQYLYDRLRRIPHESEVKKYEPVIAQMNITDNHRKLLNQLSGKDAYYISSLFQEEHAKKSGWFMGMLTVMQFLPSLFLCLFIFYQSTFLLIMTALFYLMNLLYHYTIKQVQVLYIHSIPQFLKLIKIARKFSDDPLYQTFNPCIKEQLKSIDVIRKKILLFRFDVKMESETAALVWLVSEIFRILFLLEPVTLFRAFREIDKKRKDMEEVFSFVGRIDMMMSVKELRKNLPVYCEPEWKDTDCFLVKNIYHPLIAGCVTNTMDVNGKSILLTGSNMSGKTTFMRTIMLNMLCAQTLNTCFAETFITRKRNIYSAINLSDSLSDSRSLYMQEVLSVKEMLTESVNERANLFVLDELFKGTNTLERIAIGKAVLSALSRGQNLVFVSTHDIELADLLSENYLLFHFCEQIRDNQLYFDYKLKAGKLRETNAIRILEMEGYPSEVINEARKIFEDRKIVRP